MAAERQNTKNARISDVAPARFFQGDRDTMRANFVITGFGESIARVKVLGTVIEKFLSDDRRFASITVDDGTNAIRVRVFAGDLKLIENIEPGNLILVVGKMKNYNNENYIAPDFVRRLDDPNHETMFKLEILDNIYEKKKVADDLKNMHDQMSEEELTDYAAEKYNLDKDSLQAILQSEGSKIDYKPLILEIIDKFDEGEGVEIGKILEASKLDENMVESAINELLEAGEIYEPVVGKLRKVGM